MLAALAATVPATSQDRAGAGGPRFVDATVAAGIDYVNICGAPPESKGWLTEGMGAGAAWLDYDGDGHLDLFVVNGSSYERGLDKGEPNRLYRGDGKGRFTDVTERTGVGHRGWGYGVAVGDFDGDADPDLYVTNQGANVMLRNEGNGTFADVTTRAKTGHAGWGTSAAFFDMDGDGDLDLYVANYVDFDVKRIPKFGTQDARATSTCTVHGVPVFCGPNGLPPAQDVLYRNNGDGTFTDATREAGLYLDRPRYALGVVTADFDNDGDQDVYVANDSVQNSLWRNRGDGTFEDVGVTTMSALSGGGRPQAGMGTDFGDFDGDGWLDLVVTNFSYDLNTLYRNVQGRFFIDDSQRVGLGVTNLALSWAASFQDFDQDGDLDLFIANGHLYPTMDAYDNGMDYRQRNHLFVNTGGRFREASAEAGPGLQVVRSFRGAAAGDYDEDGDVDLFVTAQDEPGLLLRNETPGAGHWLRVRLVGTTCNRDAVGARVTVTVDGRRMLRERTGGGSYLSQSEPTLHFGLGAAKKVDLEVRWPDGRTTSLKDLMVDRVVEIEQEAEREEEKTR